MSDKKSACSGPGHSPSPNNHHHHHHHGHHQPLKGSKLVIRPHSGISGDIMVAGLSVLSGLEAEGLNQLVKQIGLAELENSVKIEPKEVAGISGWFCRVDLPPEHHHRTLADIMKIIEAGSLKPRAKQTAEQAFKIIARAESEVHGVKVDEVTFHEVGALDSILDICLASALLAELNPVQVICAPLPLADGMIKCEHGLLPSPAPAVLSMLEGVAVRGFEGAGETVTPTGLGLLKAFKAEFGPWPPMTIKRQALAYGGKIFANAPNGAIFAYGEEE